MMKKLYSLLLSAVLALACAAPALAAGSYANFRRTSEYTDGVFSDVSASDWYRDGVAAVYELGLMQGAGDGSFNAGGSLRVSETVALAARLHSLYRNGTAAFPQQEGEPWYRGYADYALENGLLERAPEDYDAAATRREFAVILARALPVSALPAVNTVADDEIPDVKITGAGAEEIYRLYRAGVLTGSSRRGTFAPETPIRRCDAAVVTARMAYRSLRQRFVPEPPAYPDLDVQPAAGDDFFEDAAMLGNSLVEGMKLYSGLDMDYYYGTGANVFSNRLGDLLKKQYGKIYMEFGINEISYATSAVTTEYGKLVDRIRETLPGAEIYIMSLTPVTKARSDAGKFTMEQIDRFNAALYALCAEKQCWYMDVCAPLEGGDGFLPEDYAGWDGSPHLSGTGYKAWAEVIRTYYA